MSSNKNKSVFSSSRFIRIAFGLQKLVNDAVNSQPMTLPPALNEEIIERVKNGKYLLVIIDEKLTVNEHFDLVGKTDFFFSNRFTHQLRYFCCSKTQNSKDIFRSNGFFKYYLFN